MDEIVKAALAKWPDVPDVYGWLLLDRRGHWRLRQEIIQHKALAAFIGRNFLADDEGRWFFQNGPQRVWVQLDAAPWVVRLGHTAQLYTQADTLYEADAAWLSNDGELFFSGSSGPAVLDDRDWLDAITAFTRQEQPVDDSALADLLMGASPLGWRWNGLPLQVCAADAIPLQLDFVRLPLPVS